MTRKKEKRKNRSDSDGQSGGSVSKLIKTGGLLGGEGISVSEVLNQTNSILYDSDGSKQYDVFSPSSDDDETHDKSNVDPAGDERSLNSEGISDLPIENMASGQVPTSATEPSNADIMKFLIMIDGKLGNLDNRIGGVERRLSALEVVKDKVDNFDKELKKLWNVHVLEDRHTKTDERLHRVEEKAESQDFACGMLSDKVNTLEKEKESLKDEVVYLQSQSMRNNLVFSNIPESRGETNEEAESIVRQFLQDKMNIAKELADTIVFDRVHRIGAYVSGKTRRIVAKFHEYKEKEFVRKQGKTLQGTNFYVNEQFPKDISDKRRKLVPKMKAARAENKRAWIAYDTLYIDGKAVRD